MSFVRSQCIEVMTFILCDCRIEVIIFVRNYQIEMNTFVCYCPMETMMISEQTRQMGVMGPVGHS